MTTEIATIQPVRVSEINRASLSYFVGQRIAEAVLVSGFTVNKEAQLFMLEQVPKDIQTRFKLLELPEIKKAFDDGVRGVYGEYYGISVLTINKWLKSYIDAGEHQKYIESKVKTLAALLPEKTQLTQGEIDNIMRAGIVKCFTDYQTTGIVIDYGSPKIDWLLTNGIVNPSKEDRDEYKRQAREELENNARDKKESINRIDRIEANKEIDELISMLDDNPKIITLAKNMVLRDWFEEIIESGNDIHELIK